MQKIIFFAAALAFAGFSMPALAQNVSPNDDCAPKTLFQLLGVEDKPCATADGTGEPSDASEAPELERERNPVASAAREPGSNREAALEHANERSDGAVHEAHDRKDSRSSDDDESDDDSSDHGGGHQKDG